MASSTGKINFKVKAFVDRPGVMRKIGKWKLGQLSRVGAYARGAMKKQIRPALKGKKADRIVVIQPDRSMMPARWKGPPPSSVICMVDPGGPVINVKTGKPVGRKLAMAARAALSIRNRGKGEGKPPRRGPSDRLRRHIYFSVDTGTESVVIGPEPFPKQPRMQGRVSVPELLNKGGVEMVFGQPARYGPRPYVETILAPALRKLKENIHKKPVDNRLR